MQRLDLDGLKRKRGRRKRGEGGNITHCVLCLHKLSPFEYSKKLTICTRCSDTLRERWEYNMPVDRPIYPTVAQAYVHLFIAVRKQALLDGELDDFDRYWLAEDGLYGALREVLSGMQSDHTVHFSNALNEDGCHALR